VKLEWPEKVLGDGWEMAADGRIGELGLGTLFDDRYELFDPSTWAVPETAGWDGDRWEMWESGQARVVVLKTVWDTAGDAVEFAEGYPVSENRIVGVQDRTAVVVAGDLKKRKAARLMRRELDSGI
jgi:hypothetical protein